MTGFSKSNSGASMLYVLAALIVTGFISGALIKMTSSDKTNTKLYKTSASARVTAKSGMIAATSCLQLTKVPAGHPNHAAFLTDSTFVMGLLADWINPSTVDAKHRFIPPTTGVTPGDFIPLVSSAGPNSPRYRVEVLAFDPAERNILLRSEGIGKGGSRATMTSVYNLDGLGYATYSDWTDENAIHIEDDINLWIQAPIIIDGSSQFSNNITFDATASGSVFKGRFRTQDNNNKLDEFMIFRGSYTFEDTCFFGTRPRWDWSPAPYDGDAVVRIDKASAFPCGDSMIARTSMDGYKSHVELKEKSYWGFHPKPRNNGERLFHRFNNKELLYASSRIAEPVLNYASSSLSLDPLYVESECIPSTKTPVDPLTSDDMLVALGFDVNPCEIDVDPDVIPTSCINVINSTVGMDASAFENLVGVRDTWNGFTVVRIANNGTVNVSVGGGTKITSKFIIIVEPGGTIQPNLNGKMFSVADADKGEAGGHFTIINRGGSVQNIGGWEDFRGLFYNMAGDMHIGGSENSGLFTMHGSIYANTNVGGGTVHWYPEVSPGGGAQSGTIIYDASVYKELEAAGLVSKTGIDCDNPQTEDFTRLKLVADRLHTSLVSQSL